MLTKIIKNGYAGLQLEYFFTAGPDEVRAWTIRVTTHTKFWLCGDILVLLEVKMIILAVIIQPYMLCYWSNLLDFSVLCVFLWCSNLQKGTKAPQAAGKIHTDFEKGFIMAEVMKYSDFKEEGSESAAKVRSTALSLAYVRYHVL